MRVGALLVALSACGRVGFDAAGDATGGVPADTLAPRNAPWVVGEGGFIARWDGAAWQITTVPLNVTFVDVWAASDDDAWAIAGNALVHWYDQQWHMLPDPVTGPLSGLWGRASNDVWLGSQIGQLTHYDGTAWTQVPSNTTGALNAIAGTDTAVYAVGDGDTVVRYDGTTWTPETFGTIDDAEDVRTLGDKVIAVGEHGRVFRRDSGAWSTLNELPDQFFRDVLPFSANNIWTVGQAGAIYHYDGTSWTPSPNPVSSTVELWSLWGESTDDVWACGDGGTIVHWDGSAWTLSPSRTTQPLYDIGR